MPYCDIGGKIKVTHHEIANLFDDTDSKIKFFLLPTLNKFDAILGNDSLKELGAIIDTNNKSMSLKSGRVIAIKEEKIETVNLIIPRTDHLKKTQKIELNQLLRKYPKLFAEPDEKLTYTTNVKAEIRTNTDTPVYSKFYQYPMALKDEIDRQIEELLENNIIRPSRSPYNSPVWIVPKKPDSSNIKQERKIASASRSLYTLAAIIIKFKNTRNDIPNSIR